MLVLDYPGYEYYNEEQGKFVYTDGKTFTFEHSLLSVSEWESKYKRTFLSTKKEPEEMVDYFLMMCYEDDFTVEYLNEDSVQKLMSYIEDTMTATTINSVDSGGGRVKTMTSEVIYAYMANGQVPFECEKWHLNRLLTLLKVIGVLNAPEDKTPVGEQDLRSQASLNELRKKQLGTSG